MNTFNCLIIIRRYSHRSCVIPILFVLFTHLCCLCAAAKAQDVGCLAHSCGNLQLSVCNDGKLGSAETIDPVTGDTVYGCVYPRGSYVGYSSVSLCIGAVVGKDTLVSNPWEIAPENGSGEFAVLSSDPRSTYYSINGRSQLDLICEYYDNYQVPFQIGGWDVRKHIPLGLTITQRSMAWGGGSIDDFVMIEFNIANTGGKRLKQIYVGLDQFTWAKSVFIDGDDDQDNLAGFLQSHESADGCGFIDTLNVAYVMDNDGDPVSGEYTLQSPRAAVGVMVLGGLSDTTRLNYNWWIGTNSLRESFGPRRKATPGDPFRSIGPELGQPYKDVNFYYVMSHPEIDYDQIFTAVDHQSEGWLPPPANGGLIASGSWGQALLSFGPFELSPRESFTFTIAVVGGDNVHKYPDFPLDPQFPQPYYDQLDFSELATNARWAQWVYDNPGVDTDSDGYFGEYHVCEGETTWYKGDGVPDFRGSLPPTIPFTRYETDAGKIIVHWNGFLSETTVDPFSKLIDFEGYRVYCGLDDRRTSMSLLTTYDKQDWLRLKYNEFGSGSSKWVNDDPPFNLDSLRNIHHDPNFNPDDYPRERPLFEGDSVFYFGAVDANVYDLSSATGIHKAYPDAVNPGTDSTLWTENDINTEHGRRLPKYYEYEYIIDGLLPTVPYFVAVTVFDFGYAGGRGSAPPDETNPLNNVTEVYAQTPSEEVEEQNLDAYVYPNPYRVDAHYEDNGYENRKGVIIPDRARLIHFGNLPRVCKITILSLDGDLIGTIDHNFPEGGPESMHDWWNLVSRSGLAVESGLYYWVVESATRTQIGKLVILK
jgi:hypothetical protein